MHRQQKLYQETVGYIGGADGVASLPGCLVLPHVYNVAQIFNNGQWKEFGILRQES